MGKTLVSTLSGWYLQHSNGFPCPTTRKTLTISEETYSQGSVKQLYLEALLNDVRELPIYAGGVTDLGNLRSPWG
jgi:hypothetical protein